MRSGMQGTIKHYDEQARTGAVVTDDRTEVPIDPRSIGDDIILTLRIGQRVTFDIADEDGQQVARGLRLVTFADR
jgi:cold shock CspA family protein